MNVEALLRGAAIQIPLYEAKLLLGRVLNFTAARLATHPEYEPATDEALCFDVLVRRRAQGEPVAYLLGTREFYGLEFSVTPDVLIPRPETELLVDLALEKISMGGRRVLDLGTGSGAIAVSIAFNAAEANIFAGDVSAAALAVANANAVRHGVEIAFGLGDWFQSFSKQAFDIVVANPPYIRNGDSHLVEGDLRFEPVGALVGGDDGLDCIRNIVATAPEHLAMDGWLFIEHGYDQAEAVCGLLSLHGFFAVQSWPDLAGIARVSGGQRG